MAQTFLCQRGHSWEGGEACPTCGALGEVVDASDATDIRSIDELPPLPTDTSAMSNHEPHAWPTVAGYEILGELGRGGMGVVYKATQISLHRVVALKMIPATLHLRAELLTRFRAEAQTIAQLKHPNIVHIYDVLDSDGICCIALEYVEGGSLDQRIGKQPMTPEQAAQLVRTLALAVQAAHERGIIHRDLKPANILLAPDGTPKITDFGLAKRLDQPGSQTRSGYIMGTPHYMAPEQAEGASKSVGASVDIYALGAILFETLTGQPPFRGDSTAHILKQVLFDEAPSPSRLRVGIPPRLEAICLKCLNKDATTRYPSAGALAEELDNFLAESTTPKSQPPSTGRTRLAWMFGALVILGSLAGLGFLPQVREWFWPDPLPVERVEYRWDVLDSPAKDEAFDRLAFPTRSTGYLASRHAIYKSLDGGKNWEKLKHPSPGRVHVLHFADEKLGWLGADRLHETRDGGTTWDDVPLAGESMRSVTALAMHAKGWGLAGGTTSAEKLALFRRTETKWERIDLGIDFKDSPWFVRSLAIRGTESAYAVLFEGSNGGGVVLQTNDRGQSWKKVHTSKEDLYHVQFDIAGTLWLAGFRSAFWHVDTHGDLIKSDSMPDMDGATASCIAFDPGGNLGVAPLWKDNVLVKLGHAPWQVQTAKIGYLLPHAVVVDAECAYVLGGDGRLGRLIGERTLRNP